MPIEIKSIDSDPNQIWFEFSDPLECSYFNIYCKNELEIIDSILDKKYNNGSCTNLDPNKLYQLVVETKNHSNIITNIKKIFTSN